MHGVKPFFRFCVVHTENYETYYRSDLLWSLWIPLKPLRGGVTKKNGKIWDNVPIRVDPLPPSDI